jgi:hypothetical protein
VTARGSPCAIAAALLAFALPAAAGAARPPTVAERTAITTALPTGFKRYPIGCVWLPTVVSSSGRYATVRPVVLATPPCIRYAGNGYWILRKRPRWRIVFAGSEPPPCSLGVPRDLIRCVKR